MSYFTTHPSDRELVLARQNILEKYCKILIYFKPSPNPKFIVSLTATQINEAVLVRIFYTAEEILSFVSSIHSVASIHLIDIRGSPLENVREGEVFAALKTQSPLLTKWSQKRGRKPRF